MTTTRETANDHPDDLRVGHTIHVDATPEAAYDRVSDITRMGDISPMCTGGHWDVGANGTVGDWFTGTSRAGDREWQTRSQVDVSDLCDREVRPRWSLHIERREKS